MTNFDFNTFFRQGAAAGQYNDATDASGLDAFAKSHADTKLPEIEDAAESNYGPGSAFQKQQADVAKAQPSSGGGFDLGSVLTGGLNLAKGAGQKFQDFQSMLAGGSARPRNQPQDIPSVISNLSNMTGLGGAATALGTAGSLVQAPLNLSSLLTPQGRQAAIANYKTEGGDTPGILDVPAVGRALQAGAGAASGAFGKVAENQNESLPARGLAGLAQFATGALPNVAPLPFLPSRGAPRPIEAPRPVVEPRPRALPEPARLAIAPGALPMDRGPIAQPAARYRPTGMPAPIEGEFHELPTTTVETPPTQPLSLDDIFRKRIADAQAQTTNDLAARGPLPADFRPAPTSIAQARAEGAPLPLRERSPLEAKVASGEDLSRLPPEVRAADQAAADAGRTSPSGDVALAQPKSLSQLLADSLRAKGRPDLIVGETKAPSDFVRQSPELMARHDANEAAIAAARSGDDAALAKALQAVKDAGGSLDHTAARMREAGIPITREAIDAAKAARRGGSDAGVSSQRAGGNTLGHFFGGGAGGEGGSTTVRNALGLGIADVLRSAGRNARARLGEPGGGGAFTREDAARIRAARAATPPNEDIHSSFYRMVGDAGEAKAAPQTARGGMSAADIAAAKQRLADQMGVDARTGRPLGSTGSAASRAPTDVIPNGPRRLGISDIFRKAENVTGVAKTLSTAASPFHFMFRHALPAMVAHPQAWAKGSVKGLREGFTMTPAELVARQKEMSADPTIQQYKTYIGRPHGGVVSGEESVPSTFLNRVPVLGKVVERSGQGFVQGLNEVRYMMTKGIDAANPGMTAAQKASMGETINTFTGRGIDTTNMGEVGKSAMRAANIAMFSPQMMAARLKMLGYTAKGMADVLNNVRQGKTPDPVALERARLGIGAMTGMGMLYAIGQAMGGKTDTNPVSTTFGQTDMGPPGAKNGLTSLLATELGMGANTYSGKDTMLNPTESEASQIRTMARMAVAIYDAATQQKNLQKMEGAKQESTPGDIAAHWVWSLFSSPVTYPIAQFLEYGGRYPTEPLGPVTPMVVGSTLTGAGVEMPTIGGKPSSAPKAAPKPAATRAPVKR